MHKRIYLCLWLFCIVGTWALLPYLYRLGLFHLDVPLWRLALGLIVEPALLFGVALWISYKIVPKTDLQPFRADHFRREVFLDGTIAGVCVGIGIYVFDQIFVRGHPWPGYYPIAWENVLPSLYGGINEEVLMRLFFFSVVYFIFFKIFGIEGRRRSYLLWTTNVIVAFAFGAAHLPALLSMESAGAAEIYWKLLYNGVASLAFGWLYWSRSLWVAMWAHFVADLIIHVFLSF